MSRIVLSLVDDLFFTSKIATTASICAVSVTFSKDQGDFLKKAREMKPSLILIDLSKDSLNPMEAIRTLKADTELRTIPVIGFYSHVQAELKEKALKIGCNNVVPRSFFSQHLAMILSDGL
jgi:CheY-like chemotaxis protein